MHAFINYFNQTIQYPSGRIVNYDVDDAGRAIKVYTASMTYKLGFAIKTQACNGASDPDLFQSG